MKTQMTFTNNIKKIKGEIVAGCTFPPYDIDLDIFNCKDGLKYLSGTVSTLHDDYMTIEGVYKFKVIYNYE